MRFKLILSVNADVSSTFSAYKSIFTFVFISVVRQTVHRITQSRIRAKYKRFLFCCTYSIFVCVPMCINDINL